MSSTTAEQLCRRFSLAEIKSATGDFSDEHVIGRGGFGKVYKGLFDNGSLTVAIKRLAANSNQGDAEFESEMKTLTKFRHRNLVSLIGYCSEQAEVILVYEYMPNGTLSDHLKHGGSSLSWNDRLKICIGVARGLDYLHSGCSIIHRDVKPTNILLDDNFTPKVSDFGMAKHLSIDFLESHVIASVKGSFGYFDPSYFTTGRLTKASDTYAFGVVLLEVLSGKPAIGGRLAENELFMTMWAQERIRNGKAEQIVASHLKGEISEGCLKTFVGVVKRCLHHEPKKRLTMTRAVAQLELALEQQERKGTTTHKFQIWPFWNRVIPSEEDIPATEEDNMLPIAVAAFSLGEINNIAHCFSPKYLISEGHNGGGSVFRGVLKSGKRVAIKRLYKRLPDREFLAQVSKLSSMNHKNVVELLGWCVDNGLQVFVYEFAPKGSLHDILYTPEGSALSWAKRIEIAVGAAKGLCYIHDKGMVHRDINSSTVSLSDDETAKITDLHLSTECYYFTEDYDHGVAERHPNVLCFRVHPPEFERDGYTQKGDVFKFGLLLLELLSGDEMSVRRWGMGEKLVIWETASKGKVHKKIVDARLRGNYPRDAVAKVASVAKVCLDERADHRPSIITVLGDLEIASQLTQDYLLNRNSLK